MKQIISLSFSIILLIVFLQSVIYGQDVAKVGPKIYKQLLDNEKIRVMEITFAPGDSIGVHSHPDHFIYILSDGTLRVNVAGGETQIADVKKGNYLWGKAESHSAKNIGNTELKAIIVEIKDKLK